MKMYCRVVLFAFFLLVQTGATQTSTSRSNPAPVHPSQQSKSVVDSLGTINRQDTDYGQCIEDARRIGIESTIESYSFWSNVGALTAALVFFVYILQLKRERRQMLSSTAQLVTRYQNQLSTGHQNYQHLHQEYSQFLRELEEGKEFKLSARSPASRGRNAGENKDGSGDSKAKAVTVATPEPPAADQNQSPEQSTARAETLASMRQQLATLTQQLDQERQKNRKLRGE